ncbi:radical SAM protein [Methanothermobacter sp.]|uniref:radical SAM/SPASM domain-containing protein n=1 Tax=Methanothermobacter sp. TaxID=1884223 RepID=UPI002625C667|nr:radical SAM protein [Methanothermobacter sp.]MDI9614584.1 radical SAM protein [Methanothermobacter sp.]
MEYIPFLLVFHITGHCNLKCCYCYANRYKREHVDFDAIKDVLRQSKELGSRHVIFSGGEPLIHPEFHEILEYASELQLGIHITSNGTLLDNETTVKLKSVDAKVTISLDGAFPEINDPLRGPGTFKMAVSAIENLVDNGVYTSMRMTLLKSNLFNVRDYIELAIEKGVNRCIIERMTLSNYNKRELANLEITKEDLFHTFKILYDYKDLKCLRIGSNDPLWLIFCRKNYIDKDNICGGCTAGVAAVSINPDLTVSPCPRLDIICGSLKDHSLKSLWKKSEVFRNLRNRNLFEGCNSCQFKNLCGGCRGAAHAHGFYLGRDPQCWRLE